MQLEQRLLGDFIAQTDLRNRDGSLSQLMGINIRKEFMPSVANISGLDLTKYKVIQRGQFAYNPMHVGRDRALPIGLVRAVDRLLVSPAYTSFEIVDPEELHPEYLMMWFMRSEFDRLAWFTTDNSVRGGFSWSSLCGMKIPYRSPDEQSELIAEYDSIMARIRLNEEMNNELRNLAELIRTSHF